MRVPVAAIAASLCALPSFAVEKTVTWNLPADWSAKVSHASVDGYRILSGADLVTRGGLSAVGDPDVPYRRVLVDMPHPGTFLGVSHAVDWKPVDLGGARPLPVVAPVPIGEEPKIPAPSAAYGEVCPASPVEVEGVVILDRERKVSVRVSPFRWDGPSQTLYKATRLTLTATFDVPAASARPRRAAPRRAAAVQPAADYGDDLAADYVVVSPPRFVELWKRFVDFRKTTEIGKDHVFAVKSTAAIYEEFKDVDGDDALKIHRYLERLYANGSIKYVLLGAAPRKFAYDRETMIPGRYVYAGQADGQILDQYYGSMHRYPIGNDGNEQGREVWDWNGDGVYMGQKNADGTVSPDGVNRIDWTQEIAVSRFPLMETVVETRGSAKDGDFQRLVLTASDIIDNYIAKIRRVEAEDFDGRYGACLAGTQGHRSSSYSKPDGDGLFNLVVDERSFFDGASNVFDYRRGGWASDSEFVPRDRNWESLTYLRGNDDSKVVVYTASNRKNAYGDIYSGSGDLLNILAHGWARGCSPGSATDLFFSATGLYAIYCCPIPCDAGMMDYCPGGSYGITNAVCFGEAPVLAPNGGALASFTNTRLGGSAVYATSQNSGDGHYSLRMEWLLLQALSGRADKDGTPMDAGMALKYAKNRYGWSDPRWAAGLMGCQVTAQGDPLARIPVQYARTWRTDAPNGRWSASDRNWTIPGREGPFAADCSTDMTADLTGKGDVTFTVEDSLSSAGLFVTQDAGATLTLAGDAKYRVTREAVIAGGNLVWEAAGGVGRDGLKFVGARGSVTLPGDRPRYFGERFTNVGDILVSGGNVTIDTPRNGERGAGKSVDFGRLSFIGAADNATNNVLRTRDFGVFSGDYAIPVVRSELILETQDAPRLAATNATLVARPNPLWMSSAFAHPVTLADSTLLGEYSRFGLGSNDGGGLDLVVSGSSRLAGATPISVNDDLRVRFTGANAVLTVENALSDGVKEPRLALSGAGTLRLATRLSLSAGLVVGAGQTLECAVEETLSSAVTVEKDGVLRLAALPVRGMRALTLKSGASLHLPEATQMGVYKVVDASTTRLTLEPGVKVYDAQGALLSGEETQGYYVLASNQFIWQAAEGGVWDKTVTNVTAWKTPSGADAAYGDGSLLKFPDIEGRDEVSVAVGEDVAPGFILFRNGATRYRFAPAAGVAPTVSVDSLAVSSPVVFELPVSVPGGIVATAGDAQFASVESSGLEIASGANVRVTGQANISGGRVKRVKFVFTASHSPAERVAIGELRLFNDAGRFYLPVGTVVRDCAGAEVVVQEGLQNSDGQPVTSGSAGASIGNEKLSALIDGRLGGLNKWWPASGSAETWFEIAFPEPVEAITGYQLMTADHQPRDPKDWKVYAGADDGESLNLVATETGRSGSGRYAWVSSGAAVADRFPVDASSSGTLSVRKDGVLALDGAWRTNLDLADGAILKAVGKKAFASTRGELRLPPSGTVKVDLSEAEAAAAAFPILTGYAITPEQFRAFSCVTSTGALLLLDGDVYAATANVVEPPYAAVVTDSSDWSRLTFTDGSGGAFRWGEANVKPDGTVTLDVRNAASVTLDVPGTIARLAVTGAGALTLSPRAGRTPLAPSVLDDAGHTGALAWNCPAGATDVIAGAHTVIGGGAPGTGLLVVGAGKKATLGAGVAFARRTLDASGSVRFAGERKAFVLSDWPAARYSFENGELKGSFRLAAHTVVSAEGDSVRLVGGENDIYSSSLLNFDMTGGLVELVPSGVTMRFGRSGSSAAAATSFRMTGGTFRCSAKGTGKGEGLLLGYEEDGLGGEAASPLTLEIAGGVFEVPDSYLNFGSKASVNVSGEGVLRTKGLASSAAPCALSLAGSARLEVGSLGFGRNAAESVALSGAVTIAGYEPGAFFAGALSTAEGAASILFGAAADASLALSGVACPAGVTAAFGSPALPGTVVPADATSLPSEWTLEGGSVDLSAVRTASGSALAAPPSNGGRVVVTLDYDTYAAGVDFPVVRCGAWAEGLDDAALRAFVTVKAEDVKGDVAEVESGALSCANGLVSFHRADASVQTRALSAAVKDSASWRALAWRDAQGNAYSGDWSDVASAELVVDSGAVVVSSDGAVSLPRLTTRVAEGASLTLDAANALTVTGWLDDSASLGKTTLALSWGAGAAADAGKALSVSGAAGASLAQGTLRIGAGCVTTVRDGLWNGAVAMADASARLVYAGARTLPVLPSAGSPTVGTVEYAAPITTETAVFGSADESRADGMFVLSADARLTAARLAAGAGKASEQTITQLKDSSVVITGADEDAFVLARDPSSRVTYNASDATLVSENATLVLGGEGSAKLVLGGNGTYRLLGVTTNGRDRKSSLTFDGGDAGRLELGAKGLDIVSSINEDNPFYYPFVWSGTIASGVDTAIRVPGGVAVQAPCYFAPAGGTTMTFSSPLRTPYGGDASLFLSGAGTLVFDTSQGDLGGRFNVKSGTLRLKRPGVLGKLRVMFGAGKVEVALTRAEAEAPKSKYQLFWTVMANEERLRSCTRVVLAETGETVDGELTLENSFAYFTPAAVDVLATKLRYTLPASTTEQAFDFAYHPLGEDDGKWATASNWATAAVVRRADGEIATNFTACADSVAPALPGGAYKPVVFDGPYRVAADVVEGWLAQYALYNGAEVTVGALSKFQRGVNPTQMFVAVDASSRIVFEGWHTSGASDANVNFHVAAPSGIVFRALYDRVTAVSYYLEGAGSVSYEKGFSGAHTLMRADIDPGDAALTGRAVKRKYLVLGSGAVATEKAEVSGGVKDNGGSVTTADAVGTYAFGRDAFGTYIDWVARVAPQGVFYTDEKGNTYEITGAFEKDASGAWTLSASGAVTIEGETIPVVPALATIAGDENLSLLPFVLVDGRPVMGVKTIPGLTYELIRGAAPKGAWEAAPVATRKADAPRTRLADPAPPPDRAFYLIRVTR